MWFIVLPILIILAYYEYFSFVNDLEDLAIFLFFILAFFIVFSISIIRGFREESNKNILDIYYENEDAKKLFKLAHKYHLDLEINDAVKIYNEIIEKFPDSIYEKEAKIEINRIKGNKVNNNDDYNEKALQILYERYAKGEISKKEFLEMKDDLV
jgi:uncharacterized membrane protein